MSQSAVAQHDQTARPGQPRKSDIATLESLRSRLVPLSRNLHKLRDNIAGGYQDPPDWPSLQRSIGQLSGSLNSIQNLINEDPEITAALRSLHPYPVSPFPLGNPVYAGLANTITRKKPEVAEDKWIQEKLAKAAEFAHVPEEWGIEAKKKDEAENGDGEEHGMKPRRVRGNLNEDELAEIWASCGEIVNQTVENVQDDEGSSAASSPSDTDMDGAEGQEGTAATEKPLPPPMMSLSMLHKFMTTGEVEVPAKT